MVLPGVLALVPSIVWFLGDAILAASGTTMAHIQIFEVLFVGERSSKEVHAASVQAKGCGRGLLGSRKFLNQY